MLPLHPEPINAATSCCAVFGWPVRHSASPAMQNAGIAALGLNWRYFACEVHPEDLRAAIEGARTMRFVGLNLTVPHKLLAVDMMDVLDPSARTWGAVNTVRFETQDNKGNWRSVAQQQGGSRQVRTHGFNTDANAISRSLREDLGVPVQGSRVLLLGAGGAGRTAALKLGSENPRELYLVNRTEAKAHSIAAELRNRYPGLKVCVGYPSGPVDLALNATSLGLRTGDPLPFDERQFSLSSAGAVYDMVYRPAETPLLKAARAAGCKTANGIGMLLYQGVEALQIWSGLQPSLEVMRRALEKNVYG